MKKQLLKFNKLITLILVIAVFSVAYLVFFNKNINTAKASWWNDSWHYRKSVQVTNNTSEETNVYISLTIDTSATSTIQSDCGDLRFTKTSGKELAYYIVSGCESSSTAVHVNFETFEAGEQAIYYYYGNESAENGFAGSDFSTEASDYTVGVIGSEEAGGGPIGYWSFNEGYGTTAHDESSGGNNGTITGATWKDESECISGKCLYFSSSVDEVNNGSDVSIDNMSQMTISTWINPKGYGGNNRGRIVDKADGTNPTGGWSLYLADNYPRQILFAASCDAGTAYRRTNSNFFEFDKWQNITVVWDGTCNASGIHIFNNGIEAKSYESEGDGSGAAVDDSSENLKIGNNKTNAREFNGYIDEVKIYPYVRTANQIKQDYNAGLAGVETSHGASASFGGQSDKWLSDGLVGYWKMDESTTTSGAVDSSGNGNNGTYVGTASTTSGKFGRGGVFDGDSDYIKIGDTGNTINTVSFWLKPDNLTGAVMNFFDSSNVIKAITISSSTVFANGFSSPSIYIDGVIGSTVDKNWHHVLVETDIAIDVKTLYIAIDPVGADSYFDGKIDEVRIYNRALSKSEVQKLYEWAPGPVLHLKMDEKTGTTTYDSSGNENNGTINGASWGRGKMGSALDFDGVDDYVNLGDVLDIGLSDLTISSWVKLDKLNEYYLIASKADTSSTDGRYTLAIQNTGRARAIFDNGAVQELVGNTDLNLGWNYLSAVFDRDDTLSLYVNGVFDNSIDISAGNGVDYNTSFDFMIGSISDLGTFFDGKIDDVRIYNYARTQKQILEDMYAGNPMKGTVLDIDFNEGRGETAHDHSIFKNNGTLHSGTGGTTATSSMWSLEGENDGAVELDGVDDYISVPDFSY